MKLSVDDEGIPDQKVLHSEEREKPINFAKTIDKMGVLDYHLTS